MHVTHAGRDGISYVTPPHTHTPLYIDNQTTRSLTKNESCVFLAFQYFPGVDLLMDQTTPVSRLDTYCTSIATTCGRSEHV